MLRDKPVIPNFPAIDRDQVNKFGRHPTIPEDPELFIPRTGIASAKEVDVEPEVISAAPIKWTPEDEMAHQDAHFEELEHENYLEAVDSEALVQLNTEPPPLYPEGTRVCLVAKPAIKGVVIEFKFNDETQVNEYTIRTDDGHEGDYEESALRHIHRFEDLSWEEFHEIIRRKVAELCETGNQLDATHMDFNIRANGNPVSGDLELSFTISMRPSDRNYNSEEVKGTDIPLMLAELTRRLNYRKESTQLLLVNRSESR